MSLKNICAVNDWMTKHASAGVPLSALLAKLAERMRAKPGALTKAELVSVIEGLGRLYVQSKQQRPRRK